LAEFGAPEGAVVPGGVVTELLPVVPFTVEPLLVPFGVVLMLELPGFAKLPAGFVVDELGFVLDGLMLDELLPEELLPDGLVVEGLLLTPLP
jgi:hypothetical protein